MGLFRGKNFQWEFVKFLKMFNKNLSEKNRGYKLENLLPSIFQAEIPLDFPNIFHPNEFHAKMHSP